MTLSDSSIGCCPLFGHGYYDFMGNPWVATTLWKTLSENVQPEPFPHFRRSKLCCCCCLVAQSCPTLGDPMDCSTPGFPVHHQLPELTQIHVHWVNDAIQISHPLLSPFPPAFNLSPHQGISQWVSSLHQWVKWVKSLRRVRLFATQWTVEHQAPPSMGFSRQEYWSGLPSPSPLCIRWPKNWSFSISPFSEYSGLNFFGIVWSDLLVVQGTLKSLLQHHNLKHQFFGSLPFL